jgi:hypothetical protein
LTTKQEQWQYDVLLGMNRLLEVLHDISDTVHATHVLMHEQGKKVEKSLPKVDDEGDRMLSVQDGGRCRRWTETQRRDQAQAAV